MLAFYGHIMYAVHKQNSIKKPSKIKQLTLF